MAKRQSAPTATDTEVRTLLARYRCPVPFHEVRTRFLGSIATPTPSVSPLKTIESLWGGKLPEFDTKDAANELMGALIMGLWNKLSQHQERSAPFRLMRINVEGTPQGVAAVAQTRHQEASGFVEGLFGSETAIDLPANCCDPQRSDRDVFDPRA